MKVYVAKANFDYDGFNILGIFTTEEAATEALIRKKEADRFAFDWSSVEEFEVQGE